MKSVYMARRLNSLQRRLLVVATAMVIVVPMPAASQTVTADAADHYGGMLHAARVRPSFEVSSIRQSAPNPKLWWSGFEGHPDRIGIRGRSIRDVIEFAYAVPDEHEFFGGPTWIRTAAGMLLTSPALVAQVPMSEHKLEFDVASVRENKTGGPPYSNFPLGPGPTFGAKDGLLLAKNQTLLGYIFFAFKPDMLQSQQFQAQLPGWVKTTSYDIEARASGSPTKDDMRLMMQSLLEERFHLVIHRETREAPTYALVLAKPDTLGPRIKPHPADDPDCAKTKFTKTTTGTDPTCGASSPIVSETPGDFATAVYNMPMDAIAVELGRTAGLGRVASLTGRRVVNRTGLTGAYDYMLEFAPEQALNAQPDASADSEPGGPSFTAAVKNQLGLKLVPEKLPVEVIVVDRIERPSEN